MNLLFFLLLLGGWMAPVTALPARERPNIVFILADDLGWSDTGFNGALFYQTPHLDRLAAEGLVFTSAYTAGPNCAPTRAALMSGMYGPRHRIYTPGGASKGKPGRMRLRTPTPETVGMDPAPEGLFPSLVEMDPAVVSVAEVLEAAGYATARLGKWHLGPDTQGFGLSSSNGAPGVDRNHYGDPEVADRLTDAAVRFIRDHREGPFFLYLAHWDVHTPHRALPEVVARYEERLQTLGASGYSAVYAAMIEAVDRSVGRVLAALDEMGLAENTLVVFSSDNGGLSRITDNSPLRAGKGSLYEGGIRVPLIVRWPGITPVGKECSEPVLCTDFFKTISAAAGAKPAAGPGEDDGLNLLPLLKDPSARLGRSALYFHYPHYYATTTPVGAVREGDWKLLEFFEDSHVELFDLKADPSEADDLAKKMPERAEELKKKLADWRKEVGAQMPTLNPGAR